MRVKFFEPTTRVKPPVPSRVRLPPLSSVVTVSLCTAALSGGCTLAVECADEDGDCESEGEVEEAEIDIFADLEEGECVPCDGSFEVTSRSDLDVIEHCESISGSLDLLEVDILTGIDQPCLTAVEGSLSIYNNEALTNIDGLSTLQSVGGALSVYRNDILANLDGLSSLTSVGDYLEITNNGSLTDLDGLSSVTSLGTDLFIANSDLLTQIDGLSALTSLDSAYIYSNPVLVDLAGLSNLTTIEVDLSIHDNEALVDLDGFVSLTAVHDDLSLFNLPSISHLHGLAELETLGDSLKVADNSGLCQSVVDLFAERFKVKGDLDLTGNADC